MWRDCDVDAIFVILLSLLTVIVEVSPIINMVIAVIYSLLTGSLCFHIQNDSVLLKLKLFYQSCFLILVSTPYRYLFPPTSDFKLLSRS